MAASDTEDDRGAALEQLGGYLDVVETQLLKEIAVCTRTETAMTPGGCRLSRSVVQDSGYAACSVTSSDILVAIKAKVLH